MTVYSMPKRVKIPFFSTFRTPMLSGVKRQTARTRKMGDPGDTFEAFGATFQINAVWRTVVAVVRLQWKDEGLRSPEEFDAVWKRVHPRNQDPGRLIYVHTFSKADPAHPYPERPCWKCARPFIPTFNDTQHDCADCLSKESLMEDDMDL